MGGKSLNNRREKETKNRNILKPKEIKEKYPIGTYVTDCYGNFGRIMHHNLDVSPYKPFGTLTLGNVFIYDPETKRWATISPKQ